MATAFSSDGSTIISKSLGVSNRKKTELCDLQTVYELTRCVDWIKENNIKSLCLQFPDDMLDDSFEVVCCLKKQLPSCDYYILGDTSYGSCCVDEVAAQHVKAEAIIHFGHACLSPTNRLPVLYIFDKQPIDIDIFCDQFNRTFENKMSEVIIFYEVSFEHSITCIAKKLCRIYINLHISAQSTLKFKSFPYSDRLVDASSNSAVHTAVFIGNDGRTFQNIYLEHDECKFYIFNPQMKELQEYEFSRSKFLMRRMYLIEKVKNAKTIGILIGTLGISQYLDAVDRIKHICRINGKKSYIIAVGKPNVPKLANFPEIEVFVLLTCPENSFLDSKEYYQPIVTPYEFELACNPNKKWDTRYVTNFRELFKTTDIPDKIDGKEDSLCNSIANVSLVGQSFKPSSSYEERIEGVIALKPDESVSNIFSTGSEFLSNRNWKGLEQNFGQTEVEIAKQGRKGIPISYEDEPQT